MEGDKEKDLIKEDEKKDLIVLSDKKRNGEERPWREHKLNSVLLSQSYYRLGQRKKSERVFECSSLLKFNVCREGHEKRLAWANFCKARLCPTCSWRKSLVHARQVRLIAHRANERQKLRWLFLTLTIKNPTGDELEESIKHMSHAFRKLIRRNKFSKNVVGFLRVLEVTRNAKRNDYHPHYHVLLAVRPDYFGKNYIKKSEWAQLWKESLKIDYNPTVDIRIVKNKRNINTENEILNKKGIVVNADGTYQELPAQELPDSAIAEVAKYAVKSGDYIKPDNTKLTDEIVSVLDTALASKRLLGFGGLLKEIWYELREEGKVEDTEDENVDLVHVDDEETKQCKCSVCQSDMLEEMYGWIPSQQNYILKGKKNNPADEQDLKKNN